MIDITEKEREIISQILQQIVPEYEVWAFGSRVKGNAKPFSDLDLAIISDKPLSDLNWKVDIVDWATTSEKFREIICQKYVVW